MKRSKLKRKTTLKRKGWLRSRNPERRARLYAEQFGDHADFIRSLPCLIGHGCWGRTEPAHVRSRGAGGKARDLVPLCQRHHGQQHAEGIRTFQQIHDIDLAAEAARLWKESPHEQG